MSSQIEIIRPEAVHIDTVVLSHAFRACDLPNIDELDRGGFEFEYKHREHSGLILNAHSRGSLKKNAHEPRITATISEHGYTGVRAEVSIAKLVDGNGLSIQTDSDSYFLPGAIHLFFSRLRS